MADPTLTSRPLYEWTGELLELHQALVELEGEITPELDSAISNALLGLEGKVDAVVALIKDLQARGFRLTKVAEAIAAEAAPYKARASHYERRAEALLAYLKLHLESVGQTKLVGDLHRIRIQANSSAPVVLDVDPRFLPPRFLKAPDANLRAIAEALAAQDPEALGLAHFGPRGTQLRLEVA